MIPGYDRKTNPDWPWPGDTPVDRARKLARAYRLIAEDHAPSAVVDTDQQARRFGETWLFDIDDHVDDDRELTTAEAAELANVSAGTIRNWACLDHPERPGERLLPRFKMRGRERTYLAGDVREARAALLREQHARTWP